MRISDWSSDVCSSDLAWPHGFLHVLVAKDIAVLGAGVPTDQADSGEDLAALPVRHHLCRCIIDPVSRAGRCEHLEAAGRTIVLHPFVRNLVVEIRSEEHTSELQSLMRPSYAVFCSQKKHHYHPNN